MGDHTIQQERNPKRIRLEVQDWERKVWARAERMRATDYSSQHQGPPHTWETPSTLPFELVPPSQPSQPAFPQTYKEQSPAYPSPPYSFDDSVRVRSGFLPPSSRRPSSVFSSSSISEIPETRRTTVTSIGRSSPPHSPSATSAFTDSETRFGSTAPQDLDITPTFEQIYDVDLAPRGTQRTSILERFPMEVFMRIMMHVGWKEQIILRRCNTNLHHMVNLEAIPGDIIMATLQHQEKFDSRNFAKRVPKTRDAGDTDSEDTDDDYPSSDDSTIPPARVAKGKTSRGKSKEGTKTRKTRPQTKEKPHPDSLGRWACYCCFRMLPAHYFEGKDPKNNGTTPTKDQKKCGQRTDLRVDYVRVDYVRVVTVNPAQLPEWLVKDRLETTATEDIATYVRQRMERGVDCDDMRMYYKHLNRATHCIAPIRGVVPTFTASSAATPPGCETSRPFYQTHGTSISRGEENDIYTYEICIPVKAARDPSPMMLPHSKSIGKILQPQACAPYDLEGTMGPAPEAGDVMALRRFCIPCGAKNGAYRRDCNRRIFSKTDEGWWVCDCPKVRQAGKGKECPGCGRKVIY